jgi:hypothetical protein
MIPNSPVGTTRRIGKAQGYKGLSIRDEIGPLGPQMVTSWQPTPAEMEWIARGAPVTLIILGTKHPPVIVTVGEVPE